MTQHQAPEVTSDPCPFCRGTDLMPPMQDMWMKWLVGCRGCGAEGPQAETPNRAITAWNTRATQPLSLTVDDETVDLAARAISLVDVNYDFDALGKSTKEQYRRMARAALGSNCFQNGNSSGTANV